MSNDDVDIGNSYSVLISRNNFQAAVDAVKKLNSVAIQKGLPEMEFHYSEQIIKSADGTRVLPLIKFSISNPVINAGDYIIVAKLQYQHEAIENSHGRGAIPILYLKEGTYNDLPDNVINGTCAPDCDHCQTKRNRNSTYILKHKETGSYKQIGSDCISEFTASDNIMAALKWMDLNYQFLQFLKELDIEGESAQFEKLFSDDFNSSKASLFFDPKYVLGWAVYFVDQKGYVSREKSETLMIDSTSTLVFGQASTGEVLPDECAVKAEAVHRFILGDDLPKKILESEYGFNLRSVARSYATEKHIGLLTSAVTIYERQLKSKIQDENTKNSSFQGIIGEKLTRNLNVIKRYPVPGEWGISTGVVLTDSSGNVYKWITARTPRWLANSIEYTATMTVKDHSLFNGTTQTVVTKVKFPALEAYSKLDSYKHDSKKISKLIDEIPFDLVVFDGKSNEFWLTTSMIVSYPIQTIKEIFENSKIKANLREISQSFFNNALLDYLLIRESAESYYKKCNPEYDRPQSLVPIIKEFIGSGARFQHQREEEDFFTGYSLRNLIEYHNGDNPDSNFALVHHSLEIAKSIMPVPPLIDFDFSSINKPAFAVSPNTQKIYAYSRPDRKNINDWRYSPIAITEEGDPIYSKLENRELAKTLRDVTGEYGIFEGSIVLMAADNDQRCVDFISHSPYAAQQDETFTFNMSSGH